MSCFPCFRNKDDNTSPPSEDENDNGRKQGGAGPTVNVSNVDPSHINAKGFTFRELASATSNFRQSQLLGEGGFGRVYKGTIQSTGQVVAVKQLDRSMQEQNQFLFEVYGLSLLHHENLVELIGYCADGDQRLLVHEFMSGGSLETHLYDLGEDKKPLDWFTRLKIAYGAAQGMEYLHEKTNPPVIYRDMKAANVLLDPDFNPKLSDFGLANLGPNNGADKMPPGSRVVGTYGYSAPEYTRTGEVTLKSDVFSFGVVLLELITGRKAVDTTKPSNQQNLVSWAQTYFKEQKKYPLLADPVLEGWFPERSLNQTVAICSMCLQEEPAARPYISDVVMTLSFLSIPEPISQPVHIPTPEPDSSRCSSSEYSEESEHSSDDEH